MDQGHPVLLCPLFESAMELQRSSITSREQEVKTAAVFRGCSQVGSDLRRKLCLLLFWSNLKALSNDGCTDSGRECHLLAPRPAGRGWHMP